MTSCVAHEACHSAHPREARGSRVLGSHRSQAVLISARASEKRSYPVYVARVGATGAGVPGVPVLACGGDRYGMAENQNTASAGEVVLI